MAGDAKGIYFAPNNQGFATVLPESKQPNMFDYTSKAMLQDAAKKKREADDKAKALAKVEGFDTYRYYLPATSQMTDDLIDYVSNEDYDPAEYQRMLAKYKDLAQASHQLREYDELAFKEFDDDSRIKATVKPAYISKFHTDSSIEGLERTAKAPPPDKHWFLKETGGSIHVDETEAVKKTLEGPLLDWMVTSEEGNALAVKAIGKSLRTLTTEQSKVKMRSFAQYDETTGAFAVKDVEALLDGGALDVFMGDEVMNRVIEDKAIALHKEKGVEGPLTDETRAEVLRGILNPYAQQGEAEKGTKIQIGRDYYSPGDEANTAIAQRLYNKIESLMDREEGAATDPVLKGYEFGDYKLGDITSDGSETYIEYQEKVYPEGGDPYWEDKRTLFTIDWIYKTLPSSVSGKFEKIAKTKGRITDQGNFRTEAGSYGYDYFPSGVVKDVGMTQDSLQKVMGVSGARPQVRQGAPIKKGMGLGSTSLKNK